MRALRTINKALVTTAVAMLVVGVTTDSGAQWNKQELKCAAQLTKGIGKAARSIVKETAKCRTADITGKTPVALITDCPDDQRAKDKVEKAKAKLEKATGKHCRGVCTFSQDQTCVNDAACPPNGEAPENCSGNDNTFSMNAMGFPGPFCNAAVADPPVDTPEEIGECMGTLAQLIADAIIENTYGDLDNSDGLDAKTDANKAALRCLKPLAHSVAKTAGSIAATIGRCRDTQASLAVPVINPDNCVTDDADAIAAITKAMGKFTKVLGKKCTDAAVPLLDFCGTGAGNTVDAAAAEACLTALAADAANTDVAVTERPYVVTTLINAAYPPTAAPFCGDNLANQVPDQFLPIGEECDGTDNGACDGGAAACLPPGDVFECTCSNIPRTRRFADGPASDLESGWTGKSHDSQVTDGAGYMDTRSNCDCSAFDAVTGACTGTTGDQICDFHADTQPRCSNNFDEFSCDEHGNNNGTPQTLDCAVCTTGSINEGDWCVTQLDCQSQCYDAGGVLTGEVCNEQLREDGTCDDFLVQMADWRRCRGGTNDGFAVCRGGLADGDLCLNDGDCPSGGACTCDNEGTDCPGGTCESRGCFGGDNDGGACTTGSCTGGIKDGNPCTLAGHCPGGTCVSGDSCVGGANDGNLCLKAADCPGGTCDYGCYTAPDPVRLCKLGQCDRTLKGFPTISCVLDSDCTTCGGGVNRGLACAVDGDCPGGECDDDAGPCKLDRKVSVAGDCCEAGETCRGKCDSTGSCVIAFSGAPLPLSSDGTPVCVSSKYWTNVDGTQDIVNGESWAYYELRSVTRLSTMINTPCPVCGGWCQAAEAGAAATRSYLDSCEGTCSDSLACDGGGNDGGACTTDANCPDGTCEQVCSDTGTCDSCRFDSDCTTCGGGINDGDPCETDDDCPGDTCGSVEICTEASSNCPDSLCQLDLLCNTGTNQGEPCRIEAQTGFGTTSVDCRADELTLISSPEGLQVRYWPFTTEQVTHTSGVGPNIACEAPGFENYTCPCPSTASTIKTKPNSCNFACNAGAEEGLPCANNRWTGTGSATVCVGGAGAGNNCDEDADCEPGGACTGNPWHCVGGSALFEPCTTNAECTALGGTCEDACPSGDCVPLCLEKGACTGGANAGADCQNQFQCASGVCGPGTDPEEGACPAGPSSFHCNGEGMDFLPCFATDLGTQKGCELGPDGIADTIDDLIGSDTCIEDIRQCFANDGFAEGGDLDNGRGNLRDALAVVTYCLPASTSPSVNGTAGLGGPGRLRQPTRVEFNYDAIPVAP